MKMSATTRRFKSLVIFQFQGNIFVANDAIIIRGAGKTLRLLAHSVLFTVHIHFPVKLKGCTYRLTTCEMHLCIALLLCTSESKNKLEKTLQLTKNAKISGTKMDGEIVATYAEFTIKSYTS